MGFSCHLFLCNSITLLVLISSVPYIPFTNLVLIEEAENTGYVQNLGRYAVAERGPDLALCRVVWAAYDQGAPNRYFIIFLANKMHSTSNDRRAILSVVAVVNDRPDEPQAVLNFESYAEFKGHILGNVGAKLKYVNCLN